MNECKCCIQIKDTAMNEEQRVCEIPECENLTALVVCDDCTDNLFSTWEHAKERQQ